MNHEKEAQKNIVLKNTSDCCAKFQFDIDESQSIFRLDKSNGTIHPHRSIKVKVSFEPPSLGCYSKTLFCLLRYQVCN